MIIIDDIINITPALEYAGISDNEKILFFDIETTGFAALSTQLYLIGCIYPEDGLWKMRQWFVEDHNEEKECLKEFSTFLKNFTTLIHFNGNGFDIPYLTKKYERYKLTAPFDTLKSIDIYKALMPYKKFLSMESLKQKSVEKLLGIEREDKFSGGELIYVYFDYQERRRKEALELLLLHNRDDLIGMTELLPALAYANLKELIPSAYNYKICESQSFDNQPIRELLFEFTLNTCFPTPIKSQLPCSITVVLSDNKLKLLIPITSCELKYFYPNYKDYYYLPLEDTAMHKSVAQFVDKNYRTQAKAANCYTKKCGEFIPLGNKVCIMPDINIFRSEHNSKEAFCDLEELNQKLNDKEFAAAYLNNILSSI